jgi:hypothetical protein
MRELFQDIAPQIDGRTIDERRGVVRLNPPAEISAELVVHRIADFSGHSHRRAQVRGLERVQVLLTR